MTETPAGAQSESGRYRRVASPLHTAVVLAAIGVQAYRGAIHADQMRGAVNPNRVGMYERTILVEWLMFGFVILGVWLSGSPLAAVLGDRWRSVREVALWIVVSVTAGICEEAVYRGYLQRQFIALTKNVPAGILLSAAAFGGAHAYQGLRQAVQIGMLGAMAGLLAYWRRSVRPGMIAHALQDTLAVFVRH